MSHRFQLAIAADEASPAFGWLHAAAQRAELPGAAAVTGPDASLVDAWHALASASAISSLELARIVAPCLAIEVADLRSIDLRCLRLIPADVARAYSVIPTAEADATITVATADPFDATMQEAVERASGRRAVFELAPPEMLARAVATHYPELASRVSGPTRFVPDRPSKPSVLVVDDDPVQRALLDLVLTRACYAPVTAGSAERAAMMLDLLPNLALVITDLEMPGGGGESLLRRIRTRMTSARVPVIILTGSGVNEGTERRLLDAGADDYLRKPAEPARLLARVRAALLRSEVADTAAETQVA